LAGYKLPVSNLIIEENLSPFFNLMIKGEA
jgi:hypothetical protein